MTMADSNVSRRRDDIDDDHNHGRSEYTTQSDASSPSRRDASSNLLHPGQPNCDDLDPRSPASTGVGSIPRDSGYSTEASPANTCSPANTTTPPRHHFNFDNLVSIRDGEGEGQGSLMSALSNQPSPPQDISTRTSPSLFQRRTSHIRSTPPLRLSPEIFRLSRSPEVTQRETKQRPDGLELGFLEESDDHQFYCENDGDDEGHSEQEEECTGSSSATTSSDQNQIQSSDFLRLQSIEASNESNDDDDEEVFDNTKGIERWGVHQRPLYRKNSFTLRTRRFCSDLDDVSAVNRGECTQYSIGAKGQSLAPDYDCDDQALNLNSSELGARGGAPFSQLTEDNHGSTIDAFCDSALTCSQGFQPGDFDTSEDAQTNEPENVFTFDDIDLDDSDTASSRPSSSAHGRVIPSLPSHPFLNERPPQSPASRTRRRRVAMSTHISLTSGLRLPCLSRSQFVMSASTQTPHQASLIIQQLLESPAALPNEARGTAASRLRHLSDDGYPLPPSPVPLPDIIPVGRDRSLSAPDLQALARQRVRSTARRVGLELRSLSDEFNNSFRGNLSPVHEDVSAYSASFPGMRHIVSRERLSSFSEFLRETFGRSRGSSVDDLDQDEPS